MVNQFTVPPDAREPSRPSGDVMRRWLSEAILETWRRAVDRLGSGFVHRLSEEGGANALYFRARASARAGDLEKAAQQFADLSEIAPDPDGRAGRPWRGRGQAGPERACPNQVRRRAQVALRSQAWRAGPAVCLAQSRPVPGRDRRLYVGPAVGEGTGAALRRARQRLARRGSRQAGTSRLQLRAQSETGHSRDHRAQSRSPAHAGPLRGGAARLRCRSCRPSERRRNLQRPRHRLPGAWPARRRRRRLAPTIRAVAAGIRRPRGPVCRCAWRTTKRLCLRCSGLSKKNPAIRIGCSIA